MSNESVFRCPVCRAKQPLQSQCRRCRADLRLVVRAHQCAARMRDDYERALRLDDRRMVQHIRQQLLLVAPRLLKEY